NSYRTGPMDARHRVSCGPGRASSSLLPRGPDKKGPAMFNESERSAVASSAEHGASPNGRSRMSRPQLLDKILSMNPSATEAFLPRFSDRALGTYLDPRVASERPRGRHARWERPGDSPAIMASRRGR